MTTDPAITSFVAYENSQRAANGWTTTWPSNMDSAGVSTTGNSVIGWQSATLSSQYNNAVLLDGPRSQYAVQLDGTGALEVLNTSNNQTIAVTGETYLVFNGASAASPGIYDQIMYVETGGDAVIARLYQATFGRLPDLSGLEAWQAQLNSGAMTIQQITQGFLGSQEFQSHYGSNTTDLQFVAALYTNVLGRTADQSGETAWVSYLGSLTAQEGQTAARTTVLYDFTTSQEEISNSGSWLVDPSTGGYADSAVLLPGQTVLTQGVAHGYINTALVNVAALANQSVSAGGIDLVGALTGLSTSGSLWLNAGASPVTVLLSAGVNAVTVDSSGNTINDSSAGSTITINGGANNWLSLGRGTDTLNVAGGLNTSVTNFTPGKGSVIEVSGTLNSTGVTILDGTQTKVDGHSLNFGSFAASSPIFVNIGSIGGGTAAEVATAANKAYTVADTNGNTTTGALGEHLVFMGTDSSGNTEFWSFQASPTAITVNGVSTVAPINTADTNGSHQVDAGEIVHLATLVGVAANTLTAADLA